MEEQSISPAALHASLGTEAAPLLLDVRRESDFGDDLCTSLVWRRRLLIWRLLHDDKARLQ